MTSKSSVCIMTRAGARNMLMYGFVFVMSLVCLIARADPPYGDANQPYDRLPGTLKTFHVKWASPLAATNETKMKVLFILPYRNSRQVVELAQRLELEYTVVMCSGHMRWAQSMYEGNNATPLWGAEATNVLAAIVTDRLSLPESGKRYDAIVIGKVNWNVMPPDVRTAILGHLDRGSGLVYVSPCLVATNANPAPFPLTAGEQTQFTNLFGVGASADINTNIARSLPFDSMRIKVVTDAQYSGLPDAPHRNGMSWLPYLQRPLTVRLSTLNTGLIVNLDYHDANLESFNSLTPDVYFTPVKHDFDYAVLARALLYAAGRNPEADRRAFITMNFPANPPIVPTNDIEYTVTGWDAKTPSNVVAWTNLGSATITFATQGSPPAGTKLEYAIRDCNGVILKGDTLSSGSNVALPVLVRGNYTADLRVLDSTNRVLDFASKAFRVEGSDRITTVTTDKTYYESGQTIQGTVNFAQALPGGYSVTAYAIDTWNRVAAQASVAVNGLSGAFSLPVTSPKSRLWDIQCQIKAPTGPVDAKKMWVGMPNWDFDEYIWSLIFSASPGSGWKGDIYSRAVRPYGINADNVVMGYSAMGFEDDARYHLASIGYAEMFGQAAASGYNYSQETTNWCMGKFGRMANHIMLDGNGTPYLDDQNMDYYWQGHNSAWLFLRIGTYRETLKFGAPYYWIAGEQYLSGEMAGQENSCFCDYCTSTFQSWCQEQYANNLAALTNEWGVNFTDWSQVRGILYSQASTSNQLPRWVDFRTFMRSRVWTKFFMNYTDMMRRTMPKDDIRTGINGFDNHDFSQYRTRMTAAKIYGANCQTLNSEWKDCMVGAIRKSFAGNQSFQIGAQSMIRWNDDFATTNDQQRLPWKFLFAGYRGFDWERAMNYSSMGGESCFTPDYSQALPFFQTISAEVKTLQSGIGKLVNTAQPVSSPVAILWSQYNNYISRVLPSPPNMGKFTGGSWPNVMVDGGAFSDCLAMLRALHLNPTIVAPEDVIGGLLQTNQIKALFLPYNKGMSLAEEAAIHAFVTNGGLVVADNEPGTYSEHGRALGANRRLTDLFPDLSKQNVVTVGAGKAAYMPNVINGYVTRLENNQYPQPEVVAAATNMAGTNWVQVSDTLLPENVAIGSVGLRVAASGDITMDDMAVSKVSVNKFSNPGLENVYSQMLNAGQFLTQNNGGCDFGVTNYGPVDVPSNFDQFLGINSNFQMVADSHSGSRALKCHGYFQFKDKIAAQYGDVFRVNFYGKGAGNARFVLAVCNAQGSVVAYTFGSYTAITTNWTLISKDLSVTSTNASYFYMRWDSTDDVIMDDIGIQKIVTTSMANGSFENAIYQSLSSGQFLDAINHGWDLGAQNPAPFPTNFDHFLLDGTTTGRFITVSDARTGTNALRVNGAFTFTDRFAAEAGDTFTVTFYAKGNGTVKADMELFDTNGVNLAQSVASLLADAGVTPEVDLAYTDGSRSGLTRLDTLSPVYAAGSARYVGMLRQAKSPESDSAATQVKLKQTYYVYDMRSHAYVGCVSNFNITLDKQPKFYALLPAQPTALGLNADRYLAGQGESVTIVGNVVFAGGNSDQIGQVAHITVSNAAAANDIECYRDNVIFTGTTFNVSLPVGCTEKPGLYVVKAEYPITGATAARTIEIKPNPMTNSVPIGDDFEGYTNGILANGTNGWYGTTGIVVQTSVTGTGSNAIMMTAGSTLMNLFGGAPATNVWLQMNVRPNICTNTVYPVVKSDATAMFFINNNGNFVAHNGPTTNIYSSTNWVVLTNYSVGTSATNWVIIGIYEDFGKKTWDLYANGMLLTNGLGFVNTNIAHYSGVGMYNGAGTAYVDNVSACSGEAPAAPALELPWLSKGDLE